MIRSFKPVDHKRHQSRNYFKYRSGTVNSKLFTGNILLRIKWNSNYTVTVHYKQEIIVIFAKDSRKKLQIKWQLRINHVRVRPVRGLPIWILVSFSNFLLIFFWYLVVSGIYTSYLEVDLNVILVKHQYAMLISIFNLCHQHYCIITIPVHQIRFNAYTLWQPSVQFVGTLSWLNNWYWIDIYHVHGTCMLSTYITLLDNH